MKPALNIAIVVILFVFSWVIAGMAFTAYAFLPPGARVHPEMARIYEQYRIGIYSHIFFSLVALALGPFQFLEALRMRWPIVHRWIGKIYLVCVAVGGLAGLYMAQFAYGGLVSRLGFSLGAVYWLFSLVMAYQAIRSRKIVSHQKWMIRNFAMTMAAVTLRLQLLASFVVFRFDFNFSYPIIAWISWIPSIIVAEIIIRVGFRIQQKEAGEK